MSDGLELPAFAIGGATIVAIVTFPILLLFGYFDPSDDEVRYTKAVLEIKANCVNDLHGDIFRPYGIKGWLSKKPQVYVCRRYGRFVSSNIAFYMLKRDKQGDLYFDTRRTSSVVGKALELLKRANHD